MSRTGRPPLHPEPSRPTSDRSTTGRGAPDDPVTATRPGSWRARRPRARLLASALLVLAVAATLVTAGPATATERWPLGAPAAPADVTGELALVHGLPDHTVDVYLGGTFYLADFEMGQRATHEAIAAGDHRVRVFDANADPDVDVPLADQIINLPADVQLTVVISESAESAPQLTTFVDDLSPTTAGKAAVVVRNVTVGEAVGLDVGEEAVIQDVGPGGQEAAELVADRYDLSITAEEVLIPWPGMDLLAGRQHQIYLVGPADPTATHGLLFALDVGQVPVFSDVPADHPFFDAVSWVWVRQIADGYPDGTFAPAAPVTRQAGAAFLHRSAGVPPSDAACEEAPFSDVPVDHPFCVEISWMVAEGIATGYPDDTFRPEADISRQAMSSFLYRYAGSPFGLDPACASAPFVDVPTAHPFCGAIAWMASEGIASGYADDTFLPARTVSRQAAASFLQAAPHPVPEADVEPDVDVEAATTSSNSR